MPVKIPEPQLVEDVLTASLIRTASGTVLALGELPPGLPPEDVVRARSDLAARYAWAYLGREFMIVPGLIATEYGGMLVGREGWDFVMQHGNLHPRTDALGLRSDGKQDQIRLRDLDFGQPIGVLVYESVDAVKPLARVTGYWLGQNAPPIPDLLQEALPRLERLS